MSNNLYYFGALLVSFFWYDSSLHGMDPAASVDSHGSILISAGLSWVRLNWLTKKITLWNMTQNKSNVSSVFSEVLNANKWFRIEKMLSNLMRTAHNLLTAFRKQSF